MTNPERILSALDEELSSPVELTLYGRAALQLGFEHPREEYASSMDVDVVLWLGQAEELLQSGDFWSAVTRVNDKLAGERLYISHFFEEDQVILRPVWREERVPIKGAWEKLTVFRLADEDLFLSKLMRHDPIDLEDARFVWEQAGWSGRQAEELIRRARIPDIPEVREQFEACVREILGRTN